MTGERSLKPGDILSYSAGRSDLDPEGYRVVHRPDPGEDRLSQVVRSFPQLGSMFVEAPVLAINCYPATLGAFPNGIWVDTYLRPENLSRSLILAAKRDMTVALLGQPLALLDLLLRHVRGGHPVPRRMMVVTGGYRCPSAAEAAMSSWCAGITEFCVLHAYGAAEVDAACLVGVRPQGQSEPRYQVVADDVECMAEDGWLLLRRSGQPPVRTGDRIEMTQAGYVITPGPERLATCARESLDSWSTDDWERRTGWIGWRGSAMCFQLRQGHTPHAESEVPFWRFGEEFGFSWLDKPRWVPPCDVVCE
ncbi:MAG: hypothetical protein GF320_17620 [Armatimonadia bacterium]|nr:hypothetical protein [Armatimonadia bacterium]